MQKKKGLFFIFILSLFFVSCVGAPSTSTNLSTMQVREMTTKEMHGSYKDVFKAVMTVLQDNDYILKSSDLGTGLVVAEKDIDPKMNAGDVMMKVFVDFTHRRNIQVRVSVTISEVSRGVSKVRLNIQEKNKGSGVFSSSSERNVNIQHKEVYLNLFNQIRTELERIKASR